VHEPDQPVVRARRVFWVGSDDPRLTGEP
jgi:hypothetical protein